VICVGWQEAKQVLVGTDAEYQCEGIEVVRIMAGGCSRCYFILRRLELGPE
jgi:hypothetical protein